jgi:hypothetical protein
MGGESRVNITLANALIKLLKQIALRKGRDVITRCLL